MRCDRCGKKFSEELEIVPKRRGYALRLRASIIEEVLSSDIKNIAQRNDVSEPEIETMLKDIGEELKEEKPQDLKRLGLDKIAVVKGQKNYSVILVDLDKRKIVGMIEKRTSCQTIRRWIGEIIAYFDRRTTQGVVEGINNKLKLIKRRAYGFRNFDNFKLISFLNWHFST